jgi:hypothetical protein
MTKNKQQRSAQEIIMNEKKNAIHIYAAQCKKYVENRIQ